MTFCVENELAGKVLASFMSFSSRSGRYCNRWFQASTRNFITRHQQSIYPLNCNPVLCLLSYKKVTLSPNTQPTVPLTMREFVNSGVNCGKRHSAAGGSHR